MGNRLRSLIWSLAKRILFRMDAEEVHHFTCAMIGLSSNLGKWPLKLVSGSYQLADTAPAEVLGMNFLSRVGLAAGFDKNAEIIESLPYLGFGFAEIGTVTPRPQPGNDLPRLFRDADKGAVFNRMGFNGLGATVVSENLKRKRQGLPQNFRVGVNIGKNKDTSLEDARLDYAKAIIPFEGLADYVVVNVSSPNTPGLRSLQSAEWLGPIVQEVNEVITGWGKRPPLLLKLAPELSEAELGELIPIAETWGVDGWILTNTLAGNRGPTSVVGGWSGKPLTERSRESLKAARKVTSKPVISVGGINSPDEAVERRKLGADLVQIYSAWVFNGPSFPAEVARALSIT